MLERLLIDAEALWLTSETAFLVAQGLALVATAGLLWVAFQLCVAYRSSPNPARLLGLVVSLVLALVTPLMYMFVAPLGQVEARTSRAFSSREGRWRSFADGPDQIDVSLIRGAVELAQEWLLDESICPTRWSPVSRRGIERNFARLLDLIEQRPRAEFEAGAPRVELEGPTVDLDPTFMLAESDPYAHGKQICLYGDALLASFERNGLRTREAQRSFLAVLITHETWHLSRWAGGLGSMPVSGGTWAQGEVRISRDHLGLMRWCACLAFRAAESLEGDSRAGALAAFHTSRRVLRGREFRPWRVKRQSARPTDTIGPPIWNWWHEDDWSCKGDDCRECI